MDKMNIAVCDDDAVFRETLVCEINSYSEHNGTIMDIYSFSSGLELMISETPYNLIFLDYKMGIMNGLETAKKLRKKGISCPIIFVTSYNEIVYDVFEVNAFRFITKPVEPEILRKALDDAVELYRSRCAISVSDGDSVISILSDEITYIEGRISGSTVHTVYGDRQLTQSLSAFEKMLPADAFFRCNMACTVGMKYVKGYDEKAVTLIDGSKMRLSHGKHIEFANAYQAYGEARKKENKR